ncbi:MAG TPA: DNA primase [Terriglobia bacterium]|nr:DNA primase [Terriglobia bacterium]
MNQVEDVRAAADIVKIVGDYVQLRKAGANMMGLCPFHQEKTPSFAVHPAKQIFHCFGCGVGGDVFKFIMQVENLSFPEALERLADKVGVRLVETGRQGNDSRSRERTELYKVHEAAAKFYAAQLTGTSEGRAARAYLLDRGLKDEVIGRFLLGYAPRDGRELTRHLSASGFDDEIVEKSGLVLRAAPDGTVLRPAPDGTGLRDASSGRRFDRFRGRIIFPIANESGKVIAFGGRALGDEQPKYLNSPETPIYTKGRVLYHLDSGGKAVRKQDYAILVEGYMDCIAVDSCGIENVIASCGTSFTEAQIRLLARYSRRVVVNYDPDSAGVAATERSVNALLEAGFEVKVLALPGRLDPDSFIRKQGEAEYRRLVAAAPGYIDYVTDRAIAEHGLGSPQGKLAVANAVLPYLARMPNPILRREMTDRLAARALLDDRLLREELRRAAVERRTDGVTRAREFKASEAERKLLRAFLEDREVMDELLPALVADGILSGLAAEGVFVKLLELRSSGEAADIHALGESLSAEDQNLLHECMLASDEVPGREDAMKFYDALRRRKIERELSALNPVIDAAGREQDWARLAALNQSKVVLMKELTRIRERLEIENKTSTK